MTSIADVLEGRARWCVELAEFGDVLPTIPDAAIAHVITDPPYSKHVHTASRSSSLPDAHTFPSRAIRQTEFGFDYLTPTVRRSFARHAARLSRGWVVAFSDFESVHWLRLSLAAAGLRHWRIGLWDRLESGAPQFNGCGPANWGEAIELAHSSAALKWNGGGSRAVWRHPTQKPISLMCELVEDFTDEDDIVLDPFAGAGTTGLACLRLGRRFIGIERSPKWHELAVARLSAEDDGSTVQAARAGQRSLFGGGQ